MSVTKGSIIAMATTAIKIIIDLPYMLYIFIHAVAIATLKNLFRTRKSLTSYDKVLVTGAASGIGQHAVWKLAKEFPNAVYVLWDVNEKGLGETAKRCRAEFGAEKVHTYRVDLSKREDIVRKAALVRDQVGRITVLWNNAGLSPYKSFLEADPAEEERVILVNLMSYMWTIREFLPEMVQCGEGHLVSTCSGLGFYRFRELTSYVASKHGLRGFLDTLKLEMRLHPGKPDIRFSTIYPSFIKTPMIQVAKWEPRYDINGVAPMEVEDTVDVIVEGILREKDEIFIPESISLMDKLFRIFPSKYWDALDDHLFQNLTTSNPVNGNYIQDDKLHLKK